MKSFTQFRWNPKFIVSLALIVVLAFVFVFSTHLTTHAASSVKAAPTTIHRYGPFSVTNDPDSGTCGNTWATDAFNRSFSVNTKYALYFNEYFTEGSFVTSAGSSPIACISGTNNGNTVGAGVTGKLKGAYYNVVVSNGTYNSQAQCTSTTCNTTAGFVATVYGASATYTVNTYDFDYTTPENGAATQDSSDLGGYYGDITGPVVTSGHAPATNSRKHSL